MLGVFYARFPPREASFFHISFILQVMGPDYTQKGTERRFILRVEAELSLTQKYHISLILRSTKFTTMCVTTSPVR